VFHKPNKPKNLEDLTVSSDLGFSSRLSRVMMPRMKPIVQSKGSLELREWRVKVEKDIKSLEEFNHDLSRWRECIWVLDRMVQKLEPPKHLAAERDGMNSTDSTSMDHADSRTKDESHSRRPVSL
jgi:hypothetical protein